MKKQILLFFKADLFDLPPLISIIDSLKDNYQITLISHLYEDSESKFLKLYRDDDVKLIHFYPLSRSKSIARRLENRKKRIQFRHKIKKLFPSLKYDLLWVIHEDTMYYFANLLKGKKFICSIYELNDNRQYVLTKIKPIVQSAEKVYVPEHNRACILRSWFNLDETPSVIPNKPLNHPLTRNLNCVNHEYFQDKKFTILYQGLVIEERNIDAYCEAVKDLSDIQLVVMGNGYGAENYRNSLKKRYSFVKFIDFVAPPNHLKVTSNAHIGIVTYDYSSLNTIFCAPNKMWEYAGFGIPMIVNEIPGLKDSVGKYNAGICVNTSNVQEIKQAIASIISNYEIYRENALRFYNSFDVKVSINQIVEQQLF